LAIQKRNADVSHYELKEIIYKKELKINVTQYINGKRITKEETKKTNKQTNKHKEIVLVHLKKSTKSAIVFFLTYSKEIRRL
jgi:hypothetical protein